MYYPYLHGKQYELITVRETAQVMAGGLFVPIISPVRTQFRGLQKSLDAVYEAGGRAVVIVNPEYGQLTNDNNSIMSLLKQEYDAKDNLMVGIRLHSGVTSEQAIAMCKKVGSKSIALIHAGFNDAKRFIDELDTLETIRSHIFLEDKCGKLYQRNFTDNGIDCILIRDGFEHRRNSDHPDNEYFSDLHILYRDEHMKGFGDYLIVGDEYSDSGGPAYTVAIHLTYIDTDQNEAMFVRHFLSDRKDTPIDPGGKFIEALDKLITFLDGPSGMMVYKTSAIKEYRDLHSRQHYPGLGYVKKLSMKHHIETLAHFLKFNPQGNA